MAGPTQNGSLKRDDNDYPVMGGTSSVDNATIVNSAFDPVTRRLLVSGTGGGTGTVTSVSVVSANGFAGTVATATTTPAITIQTTLGSGNLALSNGTGFVAAPLTGTGNVVLATSPTFSGATITTSSVNGVTLTTGGSTTSFLNANGAYSTPAGSGTVNAGTAGQMAYYASSTTAVSGNTNANISAGALTLGVAASTIGQLLLANTTSGATTLTPGATAAGTLTLPAGTDTLVGKATTDTLTNKSISLSTNTLTGTSAQLATAISDETGTGALVFANTPTLTTAVLGSSTATTQAPSDNSTKLATTAYVDAAILGQNFKEAAKYATTAALATVVYSNGSSGVGATLTAVGVGALSLDGNTPSVNDRILVKNQVSTFQNGIYTVTVVGTGATVFVLTRSIDANTTGEFKTGDFIFVTAGTANANTTWAYTGIDSPVIGTDAITYAQSSGQGTVTSGNGITVTGLSVAIDTSVTVDKTTVQTLTNKTLTSPTLTTPALGTPASGVMTNVTGVPAAAILAGSFGAGAYVISTSLQAATIELGNATDTTLARVSAGVISVEGVTVPTISSTNTLTNKRVTRRVTATTQSATPIINTDNTDVAAITGLAQAVTSFTTNLSGTPVQGDFLEILVTDNGTARGLTFGTSFVASTVALPTTTVISTLLHILFEWDSVASKWVCVAVA